MLNTEYKYVCMFSLAQTKNLNTYSITGQFLYIIFNQFLIKTLSQFVH
jgi:hypothetical protein